MKLFGNKRSKTGNKKGSGSAGARKQGLSGLQKGLLLVVLSVALLTGALFALYEALVRPMDLSHSAPVMEELPLPEEERFEPPTVVEVEVQVDESGRETAIEVEVPASHKEDFYNILLLGTDAEGSRTDTIMIGRLDVQNHTVALLSVPRDTLITGNYHVPKINSVYGGVGGGEDGVRALQRKLAQTLGFETDGYVLVNLEAFVQLVDLVGGVEFDVPMKMDYEDPSQDLYIHLEPGIQRLDGYSAMGLVRFRKGYATQDIERTHVQQRFLKALADQCMQIENWTKLDQFARIFVDHVTTDLTLGNVIYFAQELLQCDFDQMVTCTLEGEGVMVDGLSYYAIYQNKTLQLINQYFNPYEAEITAANVSIRTPEQVRAEQAAQQAEEEAQQQAEEAQPPEEDLREEAPPLEEEVLWEEVPPEEAQGEATLPTDEWIE